MTRSPARKLKVGLIGCGRIAQLVHLPVLSRLDNVELVALADGDAARLSQSARSVPAARTFADYRELLAASDAEAVVICLPTHLHAQAAIAAFAAGRHVYLEKPIATSAADADAVVDAWRTSKQIGMIGFNYRFHPLYRAARRRIRQGEIGRIVGARTVFSSAARALPEWKLIRGTGGGVLLDLATHHADLTRFLFDREVVEVCAQMRSVASEDDTAVVQMRLDDGALVQSFFSMTAAEEDRFEIVGEEGKLTVDRYGLTGLQFTAARRGHSRLSRVGRGLRVLAETPRHLMNAVRPAVEPSYAAALRSFADAVSHDRPLETDLLDGRRSLAIVLAAEESARTSRAVPVAAPLPDTNGRAGVNVQPSRGADLSVVVVTPATFAGVRRTVRHLRAQSIRDRIELILVAPTVAALNDARAEELEGFAAVQKVPAGPIDNVDKAAAPGIHAASASVVAIVEDHAFPAPQWAEAVVAAHRRGPWAAVGSTFLNANPRSAMSWVNLILAYGPWVEPARAGETDHVSRHNVAFKREVLASYNSELPARLGRDGGLLQDLLAKGHRFYLEPSASVYHLNPSRTRPTASLRFQAGRLWGADRARTGKWSLSKRLLYVIGGPLIPLVRFVRFRRELFKTPGRCGDLAPSLYPALLIGLTLDGMGQTLGYALGPGRTAERLAAFEFDRLRHLTSKDRAKVND